MRRRVEPRADWAYDEGTPRRAAGLQEREVRAEDPQLSVETNARLTEELRATLGTDRVRVPADRPRASQGEESARRQEHPAPHVAAAMVEQGVSSPDDRFSEMVDGFRPQTSGGAVALAFQH